MHNMAIGTARRTRHLGHRQSQVTPHAGRL